MVKIKTMNDGVKATIKYVDSVNVIEQVIEKVLGDKLLVKSSKGNVYAVSLSDKVKLTMDYDVGDVAVIKTFNSGWLVVDIVQQEKVDDEYSVLLKKKYDGTATVADLERLEWLEENDVELQQQLKEIDDMFGGY